MRNIACVFIVLALATTQVLAQEQDLGEISVTAESWSPAKLAPGGSVVVITEEDIAQSGAASVAEVLETVSGFKSDDYGYAGSARTSSIRGSTSSQVLVIVDGVRMNDARQGYCDLTWLNLESVERIEVLKGGASSLYGADAVGGVIVVTTKHGGDRKAVVTAENKLYPAAVGSDASYLVSGQSLGVDVRTRIGSASVNAAASFDRAGDSFPSVGSDGSVGVVGNSGYLGGKASLGAQSPLAGGILTASVAGSYADLGVPGSASWATPNDAQRNGDIHGTAAWANDALADGRVSLNASAFGAWFRLEYDDAVNAATSRHDTTSAGADLRVRVLAASFLEIPAGLEFRYDSVESTNLGSGGHARYHVGAYAAPVLAPADRIKLSPSARYDWYDDYSAGFTYALGASYAASDTVTVKLTGGRSYRAPAFNDLYWSDSYMQGNPDLKPETSWFGELGGEARLGVVTASLYGYARYTENLIEWVDPDGDWVYEAENVASAAFFGADADVSADLGVFDVAASYALCLSYDLSDGRTIADSVRVANKPVHTVKLEPSYTSGPIKASINASWRSERYISAATTLDSLFLLGARVAYDVSDVVSVYLGGENLLNASYAEIYGYPMPGVTLKLGVRIVLD